MKKSKFKVGDEVIVAKRVLSSGFYTYCFIDDMAKMAGTKAKILVCREDREPQSGLGGMAPDDGYLYRLDIDHQDYSWASSMLELLNPGERRLAIIDRYNVIIRKNK